MRLSAICRTFGGNNANVIALFGAAQLLKTQAGHYELIGGSLGDRVAAKEWISLFLHEAVPRIRPATSCLPQRPSARHAAQSGRDTRN